MWRLQSSRVITNIGRYNVFEQATKLCFIKNVAIIYSKFIINLVLNSIVV